MKILSPAGFATIVQYVLREGDRQTYCNTYNHNPHVALAGFHVFLNPEGGQRNIDCDSALGGFDEIVIRDDRAPGYRRLRCVEEELKFDKDDRDALEYYFAVLLSHISSHE